MIAWPQHIKASCHCQCNGASAVENIAQAGFFLWLPVEDGEAAALKLWTETGVRVLPGLFLSRDTEAGNPGRAFIRVALVAPEDETEQGLTRIRDCLYER